MLASIFWDPWAYIQSNYLYFPDDASEAVYSVEGEDTSSEGSACCNACILICWLINLVLASVFPLDQEGIKFLQKTMKM